MRRELKRTIYIYSDSTALPRDPAVRAEHTWPFKIGSEQDIVIVRGFGGATSNDLVAMMKRDSPYFGFRGKGNINDIVILAVGVVDAAPRPITYKLKIVTNIPVVGTHIWNLIGRLLHRYRPTIQKYLHYKLISFTRFRSNLVKMQRIIQNPELQILVIGTPIPSQYVLSRSPHFEENVKRLNTIKAEVCERNSRMSYISLVFHQDMPYISPEDGHHYSVQGHLEVANRIRQEIH